MPFNIPNPFRPPGDTGISWAPIRPIDKPTWGPPDMADQLQKGIAGIGTSFEGAYSRARERGAQDQLSEYYRTHPFAQGAPGAGGGGTAAPIGAGGPASPQSGFDDKQTLTPEIQKLVDETATRYGISPEYARKLVLIESRGKPDAVSSTGAKGLTQFTGGTWKTYGVGDPKDPAANLDAFGRFTVANRAELTAKLGRPPTDGELYLAHQQGAGGAGALLGSPNANVVDALAPAYGGNRAKATQAIVVNGGQPSMTAGEFTSKWTGRFGGVGPAAAPTIVKGPGNRQYTVAPGAGAVSGSGGNAPNDPEAAAAQSTVPGPQASSTIPGINADLYAGANPRLISVASLAAQRNPGLFALNPETKTIRTAAEQQEMVDKGWSRTMNSEHRTGNAMDFVPINPKTGLPDKNYQEGYAKINVAMNQAAKDLGERDLEWGGNWKSFQDKPHYQIRDSGYRYDPATAQGPQGRVQVASNDPNFVPQMPANAPAPGAQVAGIVARPGQEGFFNPPGAPQVPVGQGPDAVNRGVRTQQVNVPDPNAAPLPPQRPPGTGGTGGPPASVATAAPTTTAASQPAPSRSQLPLFPNANQPAPGAQPIQGQGGDSVYAATAAYNAGVASGALPRPTSPMPGAAPPGPAGGDPAATGSLPAPGAVVPSAAPAVAPQAAPGGPQPAAAAIPPWSGGQMVEEIAQELHRTKGMPLEEARVRAAGATWDEKGFRLGPGPGEKGAAKPPPRDPSGAGGLYVPGAPAPAGGATAPAGRVGASPAAAPAAAGGAAPVGPAGPAGVFRPHEALAIAARGDPQVFGAMLREYGQGGAGQGDFALEHDGNGNWMKINKRTGEVSPVSGGGAASQPGMDIFNPGDPRRKELGIPEDGRTWTRDRKTGKFDAVTGNAQPYEQEAGIRKEFEGNKQIQEFRQARTAYGEMTQSANAGTGAGDVSLVYQYMKMLDPGSAVREGEFALAGQTQNLPQQVVGLYNRLVTGQRLSDQQRQNYVNLGGALLQSRYGSVKQQADFYSNVARSKGIDPKLAVNLEDYKYQPWTPPVDPATGQRRAHTGQENDDTRPKTWAGSSPGNPLDLPNLEAARGLPPGIYVRIPGHPPQVTE